MNATLGGVYLQQSVCILPERDTTSRAVARLADRVRRAGGQARSLSIVMVDSAQEAEMVAAFQAERTDEYAEICSRVPAFLEEIESERAKGRATYAEVEESEADLERLRKWLARVQARDYLGAPGGDKAVAAVEQCAAALTAFEAEALRSEVSEPRSQRPLPRLDTPRRPRAARGGRAR